MNGLRKNGLRPCPFCNGGAMRFKDSDRRAKGLPEFSVTCWGKECAVRPTSSYSETRELADAKWNEPRPTITEERGDNE
jgi:hypothetical protein